MNERRTNSYSYLIYLLRKMQFGLSVTNTVQLQFSFLAVKMYGYKILPE